jgi:hypothetical protein
MDDAENVNSGNAYEVDSYPSQKHDATTKTSGAVFDDSFDLALAVKFTGVLSSRFANGFRMNSPIELARFRSFASEYMDAAKPLTDEELTKLVTACGTTFDGKVYAVSSDAKEQIKDIAEKYFFSGAKVIFYSEFFVKNEVWLFGTSVVSEDMLISILRCLFPNLFFTYTYFGYTDASVFVALESEILRVWGGEILLTYEQLAERLYYVPVDRIKYALGQNGDFIWNSVGTFSHISLICINDEEHATIIQATKKGCDINGFISITDLPLKEIAEHNYHLSMTAVHSAVYRICLSPIFAEIISVTEYNASDEPSYSTGCQSLPL